MTDPEAQFAMSWKQFQELLAKNPAGTVNMDYDVKGAPYDSALRIPAGKTLQVRITGAEPFALLGER